MNKSKYITTTLPYANSSPHIGHAFEFIIGDALSRYFKYVKREKVFFNIGLDEHGLKIQQAAEHAGISPQEYVDELSKVWIEFTKTLKIDSYDSFYRTSSIEHAHKVKTFWVKLLINLNIYRKKYSGTYCVGCESFKLDKDLIDKDVFGVDPITEDSEVQHFKVRVCPDHPTTTLQNIEEENYFFKLSKFREELLEWINNSADFIEPSSKRTELINIIENIEDISISRTKENVSWGITTPSDERQTIYVWLDALLNYVFSVGYFNETSEFDELWNNSEVIQICGPDNLKFQAVILQGLLAAAGIKKTNKLLVHGTILDVEGHKMSKTVGNVVDPIDQIRKFGVDAVRYYALAGLSTYKNSSWDENHLIELHNSHLADDYGNLVARVTHLAGKILEEHREDINIELDYSYLKNDKFVASIDCQIDAVKTIWESYKISEALAETNKIVKSLNKKFGDEEPWKDTKKGWITVLEIHYAISKINELYYPVIPDKAGEVRRALRECKKYIIFPKIEK